MMRRSGIYNLRLLALTFASFCGQASDAGSGAVSVRVASQTVPPGGGGQIQVLLTSPSPILTGNLSMDFSDASFTAIDGIALFSPTGDVSGAAVVKGNTVTARFISPLGTFGTNTDYPLMTIAYSVAQDAVRGTVLPLNLNTSSLLTNLFGTSTVLEYKQGTLTIGGSLSITNVVPGGGLLPAGTTVSILGTGFTNQTRVRLSEIAAVPQFVSASEIRLILQQPTAMDGKTITVENPDNSAATYFSYLRGVPAKKSSSALLASTVPLFSIKTFARAVLPASVLPALNPQYIIGLALQNPNLNNVDVTIEQFDSSNVSLGKGTVVLAPGGRIVAQTAELAGVSWQPTSYFVISATNPIQMLGLLGNETQAVVLPIDLVPAN